MSATSGLWTIVALLVILGLSIKTFVNISDRSSVDTETSLIDSTVFNLRYDLTQPVSVVNFADLTMISFKVKAYSFQMLMNEPLSCDDINFDANYNIPTVAQGSRVPILTNCSEINGALNYTLFVDRNASGPMNSLFLENSQYVSVDIKYNGTGLVIPGTKLYFLYSGKNYYFTGKDMLPLWFGSLELPFG